MRRAPRPKRKTSTTTRSSTRTKRRPRRKRRTRRSTDPRRPAPAVAYLGLGSNLGNRRFHLLSALAQISRVAPVDRVSSVYRSEPVGYRRQSPFFNAVAQVRWRGTPRQLLEAVQEVERRVGRTPSFRNGPREIDVDILDLGGRRRTAPDPVLPHPRLSSRRFALLPLAEIAPTWRHPVAGRTAQELLARLPDRPAVRRIGRLV